MASDRKPILNLVDSGGRPALACSLDAGDQLDRQRDWRLLGRGSRTGHAVAPGRVELRYVLDIPGLARLRELVEAERRCCPFAEFSVEVGASAGVGAEVGASTGVGADGAQVTLLITGPAGTEEFFDFLYESAVQDGQPAEPTN